MSEFYARQWESSYGVVGGKHFHAWSQALASLTPKQIKIGLDAIVAEGNEYPPNLIKFLGLCRSVVPDCYKLVDMAALPAPDANKKPEVIAAKQKHIEATRKLLG